MEYSVWYYNTNIYGTILSILLVECFEVLTCSTNTEIQILISDKGHNVKSSDN
jgi:hypothetical protein